MDGVNITTMNGAIPNALEKAVARIVATMQPEAIYLFGSHARGEATDDSDYDLLVIVPDDARDSARMLGLTAEVPRDPGVPLDIVPCRRSVFERRREDVGTLSYLATHEGRLLYGR